MFTVTLITAFRPKKRAEAIKGNCDRRSHGIFGFGRNTKIVGPVLSALGCRMPYEVVSPIGSLLALAIFKRQA